MNKEIVITSEIVFNDLGTYQQFQQKYLGSNWPVYYHKGEPYNLIDRRELSGEEKAVIALCAVFLVSGGRSISSNDYLLSIKMNLYDINSSKK